MYPPVIVQVISQDGSGKSEAAHIEASFAAGHSNSEDHFQLFLIAQDSAFTNSTTVLLYSSYPAGGVVGLGRLTTDPPARMVLRLEKYGVAFHHPV